MCLRREHGYMGVMPGTMRSKKAVAPSSTIRTQFSLAYLANTTADTTTNSASGKDGVLDTLLLPCSRFNGSGVKVRRWGTQYVLFDCVFM